MKQYEKLIYGYGHRGHSPLSHLAAHWSYNFTMGDMAGSEELIFLMKEVLWGYRRK